MIFTAPAKINLYLRVLSKGDDGYHQIETLFERISIFDRLEIKPSPDSTTITCEDPGIPTGEDSLMGRAVRIFKEACRKNVNFHISLEKDIPVGAGLGGGSSDAATLLRGMNELAGFPLAGSILLKIAEELGADIPFFMADSCFAYGRGRGDIIQRIETPLEFCHILVTPPFEVSTKEVYSKVSRFNLTNNIGIDRIFTAFLDEGNVSGIVENLCNDLQQITLRDFPDLEHVFSALGKEGAEGVLLSGSGPTVFGIFEREKAIKAADKIRRIFPAEEDWKVFVANTC